MTKFLQRLALGIAYAFIGFCAVAMASLMLGFAWRL